MIYYTTIIGVCKARIKRNNSWNLIQMQTEMSKPAKRFKEKYGNWAAILYFMFVHYMYALIFIFVTMPGIFSYWYSFTLMIIYTIFAFKNSASYYICYFSKKYLLKLEELDKIEESYLKAESKAKDVTDSSKKNQ